MLKITIISVGKLKELYWTDAQKEYEKRLSVFCTLDIIEIKEEKFDQKSNHEKIKEDEAKKIEKVLPKDAYTMTLDPKGETHSSESFSELLSSISHTQSHIVFVIGGPLGLHYSITRKAKKSISLSSLTFTHQMARIILLEQVYRGYMIQSNRSYHY